MPEENGYLPAADGTALHCGAHLPDAGTPVHGVALCLGAFGEERKAVCRPLVLLARHLAAAGFAAWRLDWRGTGDSGGVHAAARLADWFADSATVLNHARKQAGPAAGGLLLVGVRLGANLALRLAASLDTPGKLLLVEPLGSGGEYLRQLLQRRQLQDVLGGVTAGANAEAEAAACWQGGGTVDLSGFAVGAGLAGDFQQLGLAADLDKVPRNWQVRLMHAGGGRDFPANWHPAPGMVAEFANGSTALVVRERPFWGQNDYAETGLLIAQAMELIGQRPPEPDTAGEQPVQQSPGRRYLVLPSNEP